MRSKSFPSEISRALGDISGRVSEQSTDVTHSTTLSSTFPGGTSSRSSSSLPIRRYRFSNVRHATWGSGGRSSNGAEKPNGTWAKKKKEQKLS